jgi:nitrate reductase NapAB chaperone NapD
MATIYSQVEQAILDVNSLKLQYRRADLTGLEAIRKAKEIVKIISDNDPTLARLIVVAKAANNEELLQKLLQTKKEMDSVMEESMNLALSITADALEGAFTELKDTVPSEPSVSKRTPPASA